MTPMKCLLASALLMAFGATAAKADCQIADAKLEEAILQSPGFAGQPIVRPYATCAACGTPRSPCGPMGGIPIASGSWPTSVS